MFKPTIKLRIKPIRVELESLAEIKPRNLFCNIVVSGRAFTSTKLYGSDLCFPSLSNNFQVDYIAGGSSYVLVELMQARHLASDTFIGGSTIHIQDLLSVRAGYHWAVLVKGPLSVGRIQLHIEYNGPEIYFTPTTEVATSIASETHQPVSTSEYRTSAYNEIIPISIVEHAENIRYETLPNEGRPKDALELNAGATHDDLPHRRKHHRSSEPKRRRKSAKSKVRDKLKTYSDPIETSMPEVIQQELTIQEPIDLAPKDQHREVLQESKSHEQANHSDKIKNISEIHELKEMEVVDKKNDATVPANIFHESSRSTEYKTEESHHNMSGEGHQMLVITEPPISTLPSNEDRNKIFSRKDLIFSDGYSEKLRAMLYPKPSLMQQD